jgi:uncharacterized membrane protein YiaA
MLLYSATEVSIADLTACSTCFGHRYAHHQELKSITQWLLPVVFGAVVFKLLVWCGNYCFDQQTYFVDQILSSGSGCLSVYDEIPRTSWKPEIHDRFCNSLLLVPFLPLA